MNSQTIAYSIYILVQEISLCCDFVQIQTDLLGLVSNLLALCLDFGCFSFLISKISISDLDFCLCSAV